MKTFFLAIFALSTALADKSPLEQFTTGNNLFTRDVYQQIAQNKNGNFLVSPFSAETVLAFAQSGCVGESAQELRNALHLPENKDNVESAFKTLLPKFKSNGLYTLHTANKMYVKKNFPIKSEFQNAAKRVYQADSETIDFSKNVEAANLMNNWVEKETDEKIKNLISSNDLNENTRAVLINALYFKANWSHPFMLYSTSKQEFHKSPTEKIQVDTLHKYQENFNYYECPHLQAQFLELSFKGGEASMVIVLPREKDGLSSLEKNLDQVFSPQHHLQNEVVNVALPKFKIETSTDLKRVLQSLGVKKVFDENEADLSGISGEKGDLIIDKVAQKTFIDVSEEGVEAAAATYVIIGVPTSAIIRTQPPKNFVADHPFIFYIKVKDLIIFAGRVTDPSQI